MMDGMILPEGAGGGGGGGRSQQPGVEAPNTLRSRMTARVLYLVSEGVIGGLQDGLKSVFLNDTPIQAPDGSYNFITEVYERVGYVSQPHVDGFPSAEATFSGPGLVRKAEPPPVRTINMTGRDRFSVTIMVRGLYLADDAGNIGPNSVSLRIQWRVGAGGWNTIWENAISGKCVAPYPKQLFFPVPHNGSVDVRVERITDDPADSKTASEFEWSAYSAITDQKMIYPGAAYYAVKFDAERFPGGIPTATFDLNGMLAEVPSNYNPTNRTYSGVWDGTFVQAYTDNPAWWFWTLATNPTYGAGTALSAGIVSPSAAYAAASALVDRWVLYSIAQYCDETVPDGFGGFEPRYTINLWLNTAEEAYRVLNAIASIFRGMLYWGRGQIVPVIDRPSDPVKLVTPANVVEGLFRYESTALRSRHSVVRVRWRDPAQGFREAVEVVEDAALMAEVGYRVIDYEAIGCTKRSMARRMGRWILYTEKYESGTVAYAASADHITAMPGDVILVQDPGLAGVAFSGRLALPPAAGATSFTLDREVTFTGGITYTLRLVMENGAISAALPISTGASTTRVVTTSAAPSAAVMAQAVWIISASNVAPVPYRVLAVEEAEEDQIFNVLALRHFPGKYGFIEDGLNLNDEPFSILEDVYRALTPPSGLAVQEYLSGVGSTALVRVVFSWTPASNDNRVRAYEAEALQPGLIIQTAATAGSTVTFLDLVPGAYTFRVRSTGQNGQLGAWVTTDTINVDGISDPPGPPTAVSINSGIRQLTLTWNLPTGRFLRGVEVWAAGLGFNNAADTPFASLPAAPSLGAFTKIGEAAGTSFTHDGLLPSHVWYYYLRSIDTLGSVGSWVGPIGARTSYLVAADIKDGIINTAKFAANIAPVNLIPNLSASGAENDIAFNTGDSRLYKRTAGAWVPVVRAADFSGQLTATQIASVDAATITGTIAAAQISTIAASQITGTLLDAQVAALSASKVTGQLTDAQIAAVAASKVSGTLTSAQIASLDAAKLSGTIAEARLASLDATKLTGTIAEARLASIAASKVTGTLTNAQLADLAATKITGQLTDAQIAAVAAAKITGTLAASTFPSTLRPVEVVASLPTTGNFEGRLAFLTTDDKLYRHNGTAWTASVPAADVTGTLTNSQIADLDAAKLSGTIAEARLASLDATKLTGTIAEARLASVAASKVTGTLSNTQIADLAATKITGQLTDAQLASIAAAKITGTLAASTFPSTLRPVEVVATLPATGNFEGRLAFLTTDDKLYRHNGTVWVSSVPATDITGTLTNAQIADLDAAKLSGTIAEARLASLDATKLTGTIAEARLASLAASKVTGQLTNAQLADLAAAKITGQIADIQIAGISASKVSGALAAANFPETLRPVEVVAALPATSNFAGRQAFLTTDGKLYRHDGTAWSSTVPAADVTGTLTSAQIASLDAAKLSGTIAEARLASLDATKLTGTIAEARLASLAASKVTGQLTNAQLADLAATKISGQITDAQIAAVAAAKVSGALAASNFPETLRPVEVVATLPASGNFEGRLAFLTTDDKLYRHNGAAWVSSVPATDITGTLADAQISALAASKVTGQLTDAQLAAVSAAKITGTIASAQIAAAAVTATQLANDAVTSMKIVAGAVTAEKLKVRRHFIV